MPRGIGVRSRLGPCRPASRRTVNGLTSTRVGKFKRFPSGSGKALASATFVDNPCSAFLGKNEVTKNYLADSTIHSEDSVVVRFYA